MTLVSNQAATLPRDLIVAPRIVQAVEQDKVRHDRQRAGLSSIMRRLCTSTYASCVALLVRRAGLV